MMKYQVSDVSVYAGSPLAGQMFFRATLFVSYYQVPIITCSIRRILFMLLIFCSMCEIGYILLEGH